MRTYSPMLVVNDRRFVDGVFELMFPPSEDAGHVDSHRTPWPVG